MKVLNALSRDDTEHGVYYYLASAVDAELAKKDAEIATAKYNEDTWYGRFMEAAQKAHESHLEKAALTAERDAFAVDLANSQDYAKSEYLLREKAEDERDALAKDAARYRWMTGEHDRCVSLLKLFPAQTEWCDATEVIDAAIDAALKATK